MLDPFNGGGTTGIACKVIGGRKYIGIDISEEYNNQTIKRYQKLNHQTSLLHF